jgi:hypothetical protein
MALAEQTARNAMSGSPAYKFYPVQSALDPKPTYKDEPIKEWRGQDTAQGDVEADRSSTAFAYAWESRLLPGSELVLLLTHIFGTASAGTALIAPNAAAKRYMFSTAREVYGDDGALLDKALALLPHTAKPGSSVTTCQQFLGWRPKDAELDFKGGDFAKLKMNLMTGPWAGNPEQAAVGGMTFPAAKGFRSSPKVYLGTGATLTGSAGAYTDFAPGTMQLSKPDDLTVKIVPGHDDKYKMNGEDGPSVTEKTGAWAISMEFTIDFADPSSGWSSYDAWFAYFSGINYVPAMIVLDSKEIIPSCTTQVYALGLYVPKMQITFDTPDRKADGSKPKIKVSLKHFIDPTENIAAYAKLIC